MLSPHTLLGLLLATSIPSLTSAINTSPAYIDLYAHPKYHLAFNEKPGKIWTLSEVSKLDLASDPSLLFIPSASTGKSFLCKIPQPPPPPSSSTNSTQTPEDSTDDKIKQAVGLLKPMEKQCLYYFQGWWHYEYCHNRHVRQYHPRTDEERKRYPEKEQDYFLGRHPTKKLKKKSGKMFTTKEMDGKKKGLGLAEWEIIDSELDGKSVKYLKQKWSDGTKCEVGDVGPRSIELHYYCNINHELITQIREIGSCKYVMTIYTPRLCVDPTFIPAAAVQDPSSRIVCEPVVPDSEAPTPPPLLEDAPSAEPTAETPQQQKPPLILKDLKHFIPLLPPTPYTLTTLKKSDTLPPQPASIPGSYTSTKASKEPTKFAQDAPPGVISPDDAEDEDLAIKTFADLILASLKSEKGEPAKAADTQNPLEPDDAVNNDGVQRQLDLVEALLKDAEKKVEKEDGAKPKILKMGEVSNEELQKWKKEISRKKDKENKKEDLIDQMIGQLLEKLGAEGGAEGVETILISSKDSKEEKEGDGKTKKAKVEFKIYRPKTVGGKAAVVGKDEDVDDDEL
ncbi:Protein OS-9 [Chytridiales sp. JEL 0842]|nr:Protein OS-9 [Chytridiales sp. JEL 0842]